MSRLGPGGTAPEEQPLWAAAAVRAWWPVALLAGGTGLLLTPFVLDPGTVVPAALTLGVLVGVLAGAVRADAGHPAHRQLALAVRDAMLGALAAAATGGWLGMLGPEALLGVLALAATSPPAVRRLVARLQPDAPAPAPVADAPHEALEAHEALGDRRPPRLRPVRADQVASMSSHQIGVAWCRSGRALTSPQSVTVRVRVVQLRQLYLDELERRDPVALHSWLAAEPRAVSDPAKFFGDAAS